MLSHTPPSFSGSYDMRPSKRARAGSISGRLRSASDLCEEGLISHHQKGVLKDMIISGDPQLEVALRKYDEGDPRELRRLIDGGILNRRSSLDLQDEDLDLGFLNMGSLASTPKDGIFSIDDLAGDALGGDGLFATSLGSMPGLGMSPHDAFAGAFLDEIADTKFEVPTVPLPQPRLPLAAAVAPSATVPASYSAHSAPIGIPGAPKAEPERPPMEYVPDHEPEGDVVGSSMEQQPKRYIGAYSPEARRKRIERFWHKRQERVWTRRVKYDVRKNFADSRLRVKGRFVKKEDEELLREVLNLS